MKFTRGKGNIIYVQVRQARNRCIQELNKDGVYDSPAMKRRTGKDRDRNPTSTCRQTATIISNILYLFPNLLHMINHSEFEQDLIFQVLIKRRQSFQKVNHTQIPCAVKLFRFSFFLRGNFTKNIASSRDYLITVFVRGIIYCATRFAPVG